MINTTIPGPIRVETCHECHLVPGKRGPGYASTPKPLTLDKIKVLLLLPARTTFTFNPEKYKLFHS